MHENMRYSPHTTPFLYTTPVSFRIGNICFLGSSHSHTKLNTFNSNLCPIGLLCRHCEHLLNLNKKDTVAAILKIALMSMFPPVNFHMHLDFLVMLYIFTKTAVSDEFS